VLETERLRLREWEYGDRGPFAQINADLRVMEFFPKCLNREESDAMVDRIESHFRAKGFGLYAAELRDGGRFIGYVGLHTPTFEAHFTPCVEIGWRLASDVWGKGLATEGALAVVQHAFENLGLDEIVSFTVPANRRSIRVMEKIGMTRDAGGDFEHPNLPAGHPLRHHVLYRLANR
jgi:RimJ/RimL family protein N-acetyltransferase